MARTPAEIIEDYRSEYLDIIGFYVTVDGYDEKLEYSETMDPMPEKIHLVLPEYCTYNLVLRYRVKKRPIKNLSYYQAVKKAGIPIKTRKMDFGDVEPNAPGEYHTAVFVPDTLPGGMFTRGTHPATTTFSEEDGKTIFAFNWFIEIAKKDVKPSVKLD
ncbi:hypothetical protein CAAN1_14S03400 [[Candida] anglica]|uniref:E set domain-containing protein n=1 Tax=[Candida] anglica TaxID=148631 RepID=A0ABP0EK44_9ASCO